MGSQQKFGISIEMFSLDTRYSQSILVNCPATATPVFFATVFTKHNSPEEALTEIQIPETQLQASPKVFLATLPYQFLKNFLRLAENEHQAQLST